MADRYLATKPRPGEIVRLRSGGPMMTVLTFSEASDAAHCMWFDLNSMPHEGHFLTCTIIREQA
jgi:uncharacterized protein YodC (DUF2158 family)